MNKSVTPVHTALAAVTASMDVVLDFGSDVVTVDDAFTIDSWGRVATGDNGPR